MLNEIFALNELAHDCECASILKEKINQVGQASRYWFHSDSTTFVHQPDEMSRHVAQNRTVVGQRFYGRFYNLTW